MNIKSHFILLRYLNLKPILLLLLTFQPFISLSDNTYTPGETISKSYVIACLPVSDDLSAFSDKVHLKASLTTSIKRQYLNKAHNGLMLPSAPICAGKFKIRLEGNVIPSLTFEKESIYIYDCKSNIIPDSGSVFHNGGGYILCRYAMPVNSTDALNFTVNTKDTGLNSKVLISTNDIVTSGLPPPNNPLELQLSPKPEAHLVFTFDNPFFISNGLGMIPIMYENMGPSAIDYIHLGLEIENSQLVFPETQPNGISWGGNYMIYYDKEFNNPIYLSKGQTGNLLFNVKVKPLYAYVPRQYTIQTIPGIKSGLTVDINSSLEIYNMGGSTPLQFILNLAQGITDIIKHYSGGKQHHPFSYDLTPTPQSTISGSDTAFKFSYSGTGVRLNDIRFNKDYLNCTQLDDHTATCSLLPNVKLAGTIKDAFTADVGFTTDTTAISATTYSVQGTTFVPFSQDTIKVHFVSGDIPAGTYQSNCNNIHWQPDALILSAQCQNANKQWVSTTLDYYHQCWQGVAGKIKPSTVKNVDGQLTCAAIASPPGGSWQNSCQQVSYDGSTLSASCATANGQSHSSSLAVGIACAANATTGALTISNDKGTLTCDASNFTKAMQQQCTVTGHWDSTNTLSATCNGIPSSFNGDEYHNECLYASPLTVSKKNQIVCSHYLIPASDYMTDCTDVQLQGTVLQADCLDNKGVRHTDHLTVYQGPDCNPLVDSISNQDGKLVCTPQKANYPKYDKGRGVFDVAIVGDSFNIYKRGDGFSYSLLDGGGHLYDQGGNFRDGGPNGSYTAIIKAVHNGIGHQFAMLCDFDSDTGDTYLQIQCLDNDATCTELPSDNTYDGYSSIKFNDDTTFRLDGDGKSATHQIARLHGTYPA